MSDDEKETPHEGNTQEPNIRAKVGTAKKEKRNDPPPDTIGLSQGGGKRLTM